MPESESGCNDASSPQRGQQLIDFVYKFRGSSARFLILHRRTRSDSRPGRSSGASGALSARSTSRTRCAGSTLRPGRSSGAGGTSGALSTRSACRTRCAGGTLRPGRPGRTGGTGGALSARSACRARCAGGTLRPGRSGGASHLYTTAQTAFPPFSQSPTCLVSMYSAMRRY